MRGDGYITYVRKRVSMSTKSLGGGVTIIRMPLNGHQSVIDYKALAKRSGLMRKYDVKVGIIGSHSTIGQAAQAIGSMAIPGNMSPLRNPVRAAGWSAITPGKPNLPGGVNAVRNQTTRCPEGYQYGGRFTDNRLSTCGAQLFDIPSALGLAIGALRRLARGAKNPGQVETTPVTGVDIGDSLINARRPTIPRVGNPNPKAFSLNSRQIIRDMGQSPTPVARMVRKDGFVLEPVVPAQVLRAIPDNRDMEGANYLTSIASVDALGGQELGLLSNTGVTKLTYVLPGGSSITLDKKRPLTVGERRKLGRTVNSAANIDITDDPTARLKEVVNQTGDGIGYSESFVGIKNPNEVVAKSNGKSMPRWVDEVFGKGKKAKPIAESMRQNDSESAIGKDITSIDEAVSQIASGGSLANIDPMILQEAINKANSFKREKLDASREIITAPDGRKYIQYSSGGQFEHIGQKFASDLQQHLGLESPDVFFVGEGDKRKYLTEEPSQILRGFQVDRRKTLKDYEPEDIAKLMVSDWLTDQRQRDPGSIIPMSNGEKIKPVITNNTTSGLAALDELKIVERQKMTIAEFFDSPEGERYAKYFMELQQEQRFSFRREIDALLLKARQFNFTQFKTRLYNDGKLSSAEKAHLNIIGKILESRINRYASSRDTLMKILGANK